MKKLYVLDASGYLYRSYFAIRNMTNAQGESTNALFGFIRSILKLQKDFQPDYMVSVFDGHRSIQHREKIYADYKAHRTATPADLIYQIQRAQFACQLMGIPYLSVPEVEADDTMGSIALWAAERGTTVYLCTSDKDLSQLVNERILLLNTHKENQLLGPDDIERVYGAPAHQMVDLLAMVGDASDNVPGLPGFGPKTASALLKEYGSLDYILEHPEVVSGKKRETILEHGKQALMSRQLVTIHTTVEFPKEESFFAIKPIEMAPLKEFYSSMSFNSLIRELEQNQPVGVEVPDQVLKETIDKTYTIVDDEEAFTELLKTLSSQKEIAITVKGSHEQPIKAELIGIGFSTSPGTGWYVPANGKLGSSYILQGLKPILENAKIGFCGHNIKYDYLVLANYDIQIATLIFDTMLAAYLLNSHVKQHDLERLFLDYFGRVKPDISELLGKGKAAISLMEVPVESLGLYCCEEADYIYRLKQILGEQLAERKLAGLLLELELPLLKVLAQMERRGIYIDLDYFEQMSKEVLRLISILEQEIYELAGETFNINSSKQLSQILFTKLGIKAPKKTATGLSTNADVLESLRDVHPITGKILEYRTLEKLRSTYLDALPFEVYSKTDRIHCTFNQTVAATGRLSCQDPNLQNIPIRTEIGRKIREGFRPEKEGWSYLGADYSQIELRLLAHFSEDKNLIEAFNKGEDVHAHTAASIFDVPLENVTKEMRHNAKAVNFGVVYGQQAYGLSQATGIDMKEAGIFIEKYFARYPGVKRYIEESKATARKTGKTVTYTGRERLIPEINSQNGMIRSAAERLAINTPLQGTAADLIKMAMLALDARLCQEKLQGYMVLQIHDELILEIPDHEIEIVRPIIREVMQNVLTLKVPLVVDISIGKNWAEC